MALEDDYLTFTSIQDGSTVGVAKAVSTIQYSKDGQEWKDLADGVTLNNGEKIYVKTDTVSVDRTKINQFSMTGKIEASGNIASMGQMQNYCYHSMFYGCTGLTTAPELPATTLANNCYENMFTGSNVKSISYFCAPLSQSANITDFATMGITEIYLSRQGKRITSDGKNYPTVTIKNAPSVRDCNVKAIEKCYGVERCQARTYTDSYYSNDANDTYKCANTLNGGWNK